MPDPPRDLVQEFSMPLHSLGFNDRRDAAFRWIVQSLQTILDPRPILKRSASTMAQQTAWLRDTAPLDPAWKKRVQHSYRPLVDTLAAYPDCLKVTRGPTTIAPIDLVIMALLVFEFHDKLSPARLADALHGLRMAARKETKDLMWKGEHMGFCLVFLDRLEKLGEAALGGKDAPVAIDVDLPPKRQRTGGTCPRTAREGNKNCCSPRSQITHRRPSPPQQHPPRHRRRPTGAPAAERHSVHPPAGLDVTATPDPPCLVAPTSRAG
jgi:hypothetical protein